MAVALTHLSGRTIAVFGLARSGLATVQAARQGGAAKIRAWDDNPVAHAAAETAGASIAEPGTWPWSDIACLVLAPGVPLTHPEPNLVVGLARAAGVEIICDIELLFRQADGAAKIIAVTGTNGKSTATALIGHILNSAGMDAEVGGNIGRAALDLRPPHSGLVYVLELSSYQLDLTRHSKIFVGQLSPYPHDLLHEGLARLDVLAAAGDDEGVRRFLDQFLPEARLELEAERPARTSD